jgi:hypothetical protein
MNNLIKKYRERFKKWGNFAIRFDSGQAMMMVTIFFLVISLAIIFGLTGPLVKHKRIIAEASTSRQSYFWAEAGIEDTILRLKKNLDVLAFENLRSFSNASVDVTVADTSDGKVITAESRVDNLVRKVRANIIIGSGVSFHYGIQAGNGGIILENTSSVDGNVYSNGPANGNGPTNNFVRGVLISAGPDGLVNNLRATSSVYAHTITNATIDGNAYYQVISGSSVAGTRYLGSADQDFTQLPIPDSQIDEWKSEAEAGGEISAPCPYKINSATTIGPVKINCDLEISGNNYNIILNGNVWVVGNIKITNSPTLMIPSSFGNLGVAVIADNPSNQTTSSKISLANSAVFQGSGAPRSFIFFVSQNKSAEIGGGEVAIDVQNTVSGDLLVYAGHGELSVQNNVELREATAHRIRLKNSAKVKYKTGLANLLFSSGPSGGYEILNWEEVE